MMDEIDTGQDRAPERWAARPFLLAGLGLATGIVAHLILGETNLDTSAFTALQGALLIGVTMGAVLMGFTIERRLWWAALAFGVVMGIAGGLVTWWNGAPAGWSQGEVWRTMSLFLAVAIAAPLFQAARDESTWRPSYPGVHDHLWANVVLWCASWAFVGLTFIMSFLLASLFQLIKIDLLHDLLMKNWFCRALIGLAFGSALGVLREHDAVVRMLQRVITTLLAVLAPVLAAGLALFLLALPFTGVKALWDATSATTPLLLACAAGALILANDVIGAHAADERRMPVLRYAAMVLAAVILPLGVLAAVATDLRIGQYGYTPERLWAVVFVGIACLWGAAYLVALVRGRMHWAERVRPANLVLAAIICLLGFVLAMPLISFNAISTRDQVARLESGKITAETFDWKALAFDFGQSGRDALKRLAASKDPAIRAKAIEAAKSKSPYELSDGRRERQAETLDQRLRVLPAGTALPPELRKEVAGNYPCGLGDEKCTLVILASGAEAVLLPGNCFPEPEPTPSPSPAPGTVRVPAPATTTTCALSDPNVYVLDKGKWIDTDDRHRGVDSDQSKAARAAGYRAGQVEIRTVPRRQVFVGGVPVGEAFE